jgi:esterase
MDPRDSTAAVTVDDELASLPEFALLAETARHAGVDGPLPAVTRIQTQVDGREVSALRWGTGQPEVVLLHGGGQNAHTWDTVVLALGRPALAVDLPGHGRSAWRADRDYTPWANAETLAAVLRVWAPDAEVVVGMSLGGLTTIRLARIAPDLVRRAVIVDVTPGVTQRHAKMTTAQRGTTALPGEDKVFPDFQAMFDRTVAAAPNRDRESLRRGVLHNARRLPDGTWTWRYDQLRGGDHHPLWDDLSACTAPMTLVRGAESVFVSDADAAEFARRSPGLRTHVVDHSGHSVQSDRPHDLAAIIRQSLEG